MSQKTASESRPPKVTKKGLTALSKSPGDRTPAERKQAKKTHLALKEKDKQKKQKEAAQKKQIKEAIKKASKGTNKFTGIKRLAYRVKLFWAIKDSRPKRFYPVTQAIDTSEYEVIKECTIILLERCINDDVFADEAIGLWTLLDSPPPKTRRANLAASCRDFADLVLDSKR
jgi:hypothetical protein